MTESIGDLAVNPGFTALQLDDKPTPPGVLDISQFIKNGQESPDCENQPVQDFITISERTDKARIDNALLIKHLTDHGFRKLPTSTDRQADLVRIDGCFIERIDHGYITDYLKNYIRLKQYQDNVFNALIKKNEEFNAKFWLCLDKIELPKNTDTAGTGYYFFKNCFVEITAESIQAKPYSEFKGYIWKHQTQPQDFVKDETQSEFSKFCMNTQRDKSGQVDPVRWKSFLSAIGYILHKYHDQSNARALIMQDEQIRKYKNEANGGTGKSLIAKSLRLMRPGFVLDCKTADFKNDSFLYDGAKPDDQTLTYDDVKNNFPFEFVFNQVQAAAYINAKFKNKEQFHSVPKYIITSNSIVDTSSASSKRRAILLFCSEYYNGNRTPFSEFKHNLFVDWDNTEWNRFYNFMLQCLQFHLQIKKENNAGFIDYEPPAFKHRQVIELYGYEAYQWLTDYIIPKSNEEPQKLDSDAMLESYISDTGYIKTTKSDLTHKIRKYAEISGLYIDVIKSNGKRFYLISEIKGT